MGPFQAMWGCLFTKTGSLNGTHGQVVAKHTYNIVFKSQHDQASPLVVTRGVVTDECASVDLWAHSRPYGVCVFTKTGSLMVTPGQEVAKHTLNNVFKYQHEQATPIAVTRGVVTAECASVDLWAHSSPYGVVYLPKLHCDH